jgi:acyl-CoA synthetase (AMP-forming)/AMP-acid ligase II/peptidoglycan/LPS O-acetylase OafA/YrhL
VEDGSVPERTAPEDGRGLGPGVRAIGLVARNCPDYYRQFAACMAEGIAVVPLRSREDRHRIEACGLSEIREPEPGHGWFAPEGGLEWGDGPALVAFTSGTQGEPKGVVQSRTNLADTTERLAGVMQADASIREYVGVPIFHAFGLARLRLVARLGGRAYLPAQGFDPREVARLLAAGEINAVSAVATMARTLLRHRDLIAPHGHRLRWMEIGSQPIRPEEKRALRALFPNARIVEHYGLTEASKSTFLVISEAPEEELATVGRPVGAVEVAVGADGRIRIRGPNVARTLIVGGRRVPNVDAEGWFETGDIGRMQGANLCHLGRADDVINAGGLKISADLLEAGIARALGIEGEVSVARIPDALRGDGILVAVRRDCAAADAAIEARALAVLAENGIQAAAALRLERVEDFPRTESGKIRRKALAEAVLGAAPAAPAPAPGTAAAPGAAARLGGRIRAALGLAPAGGGAEGGAGGVRAVFAAAFPRREIGPGDSFASLGGDSLGFVEVSIGLERLLGRLPEGWPEMRVAELEAIRPRAAVLHPVDTTLLLRAVGILAIVAGHFTSIPTAIGGATFLLLALAGYNFARFQLRTALAEDRIRPLLVSTARIALPLVAVAAAIGLRQGSPDPLLLLGLGNFEPAALRRLDFWFVEVLVQILLLLALAFALPGLRRAGRAAPLGLALGVLGAALAAAFAGPLLWDTEQYYDRMAHMMLWLFALGWVLHEARAGTAGTAAGTGGRAGRIALGAALALAVPLLVWGVEDRPFWVASGPVWVGAGALLVLAVERVPVPWPVNRLAYWIGGASLFIYLTHWTVRGIWHRVTPVQSELLDVAVAVVAGVLAWLAWEAGTRALLRLLGPRAAARA